MAVHGKYTTRIRQKSNENTVVIHVTIRIITLTFKVKVKQFNFNAFLKWFKLKVLPVLPTTHSI